MRLLPVLFLAFSLAGCSGDPAPKSPERELASLAWKLKTAVESDPSCRKVGAAVASWEAEHGARFAELVATVPKLTGGNASNYERMEVAFRGVAARCVRPEHRMSPIFEHNADVERIYKMLPEMEHSYEMRRR